VNWRPRPLSADSIPNIAAKITGKRFNEPYEIAPCRRRPNSTRSSIGAPPPAMEMASSPWLASSLTFAGAQQIVFDRIRSLQWRFHTMSIFKFH
jgi:hypothetical protein